MTVPLITHAKEVIPGGVNSAIRVSPGSDRFVITGSSGPYVSTDTGRTILDFQSAYGATVLGHNDPDVDRAVAETARRLDNPGYGVTDAEVTLADMIIDRVASIEKVLLVNTGSEATYLAIRVARSVTGRPKILKFEGAYHGWHDSVLVNTGTPASRLGTTYLPSTGVLPGAVADTLVATWNDLDDVEAQLARHEGQVAAILVDPILSSAGGILPQPGFLEGLRRIATAHGALLVFDELITGFRVAVGGYQSLVGVDPDLTTFGKAIGNGYPIAGIGGTAAVMDEFSNVPGGTVYMGGTYNGHPAMAAAAIAVLEKMDREPVHAQLDRLGARLRAGLQELYTSHGIDATVTGIGSVWFPFLLEGEVHDYRDSLRHDRDLLVRIRSGLLEDHDILVTPVNWKSGKLNYSHTEVHVDRLLAATDAVLTEVSR
ncbi:aspartate aminotransferase family protein [Raineyella sp. W15-4]|uniref:aspartate aminotransferase family protein n=1 Tax=Raineyella sp. W15-4 TaxID=3081651 RepID=UPI0029536AF4|nr:aspartate aminotransferase family protein [Raineyella sp. W15-4]WOQ15748.1 aspartate aminotransferase family protein [Raineyella sp. W15-4]